MRKKRQRNKLVILLARVGLQSFNGLDKVDDGDGLAARLNHKTLASSSEDPGNNGVSERCLSSQWPSTSRLKTQHLHWPAFTRCTFKAMSYKKVL